MKLVAMSLVCTVCIKMQFDGFMTLHYIYLKEGHTTYCSGKDRSVPKGQ